MTHGLPFLVFFYKYYILTLISCMVSFRLLLVSVDLTFSIRVSNMDPDQDPCSVGLDLGSNF